MGGVRHDQIAVGGGVELHVTHAGPQSGTPVVLLHGFPELAFSWRKQLAPLARAGYHVIAPDLRGYGRSSAPEAVEAYDLASHRGDILGLLDAVGARRAAIVGHDWGATLAWNIAQATPERAAVVVGMSVPAVPRAPAPPIAILRRHLGEDFYMVWFQEPGVAEAALEADVRRTLTETAVWDPEWAASGAPAKPRPAFLTEEELAVYVTEYTRTGFRGGLGMYRNVDRNWEAAADLPSTVDQPALFIGGSRDPVARFMPHQAMDGVVTDLRDRVILEGAGHWVQQQRPDEVNAALLEFLAATYPASTPRHTSTRTPE